MGIEGMKTVALWAAVLMAFAAATCCAATRDVVTDIPGEVLVLEPADRPDAWNEKALGGNSVGVAAETELVMEGGGAVRWKCAGNERERFGFALREGSRDWSNYDQVQFWCYSQKDTTASLRPLVRLDGAEYRMAFRIEWVGWRLVTLPLRSFGKDDSWAEVKDFGKEVNWKSVRSFGFEEHTYYQMGFYPLVDTDLTVDSVVLTRKILEGSLKNETGTQTGPITYKARIKNLSEASRTCILTVTQQRLGEPSREIKVDVSPGRLEIEPGGEAVAEVTFTVPQELMSKPLALRDLVVSVNVTLTEHVMPQLEFRVPCRRLFFDTIPSEHPRLYFNAEGLEALKKRIETDKRTAELWKSVLEQADSLAGKDLVEPRDKRKVLEPIRELSLAYLITGEEKYAAKVRQYVERGLEMEALNHSQKPTAPRATNLATGHHVMSLAIAYDWLYDFWTDEQRKALRRQFIDKGLEPHRADCQDRYAWGHRFSSNWTAVVSGGSGVGAMAVLGDEPDASLWAEFATDRMEHIAEIQGIDGGTYEGTSYWNYNMRFCDFFTDALRTATGGRINLFREQPFFRRTCDFYLGSLMPEGQWANFADAWHNGHYRGPIASPSLNAHFLRIASEFKDGYLQWKAKNAEPGLFSLLWYDPSVEPVEKETRPLAQLFRGPQYAILRASNEGVDAAALAIKAGSNSEDHGHFDVLTFVVSGYGYQLAADYWPSKYSAPDYFGFTRHHNKRAATFGHNCILVDGQSQIWGREIEARFDEFFHSPAADYLQVDGSKMYPPELLSKWKRHVLFVRPSYFVMWDEMASPKPVEYQWRMMTWGEQREPPRITDHGALVTVCAYQKRPDKAAQLKLAQVSWKVPHSTFVDRFVFDPQIDRLEKDKRQNFFLKTYANEKTDNWTLLTMLFPVDKADSKGRGDFEPIRSEGVIGAKISDVKDPAGPDIVLVNLAGEEAKAGEITFTGRAALVSGGENPKRYALILGTKLARGQTTLISADAVVTAAVVLRDGTWVGAIQAKQDTEVRLFTGPAKAVSLVINGATVEAESTDGVVTIEVPASTMPKFLEKLGATIGQEMGR